MTFELNERSLFDGPPPGKNEGGAWPRSTLRDRKKQAEHDAKWRAALEIRETWDESKFAEEAEILEMDIATFPIRKFDMYGNLIEDEDN